MAVLLGLTSALCWGTADFLGGMQSRRLPAFAVVLWSELAGASLLLLAIAIMRVPPVLSSLLWGMIGGIVGACALILFYQGLATGIMSLVAPVSACGVAVPVAFSILAGHVPKAAAVVGIAAAFVGILLVSFQPSSAPKSDRLRRSALYLALGSALGFGLFFVFVSQGTGGHDGSPLWAIVGARLGSLLFLPTLIPFGLATAPWPRGQLAQMAIIGSLDTGANLLFAFATVQGQLSVVAVLVSLYPVTTVLLGQIVLSERLSISQGAGVGFALGGVVLLSLQ